MARLSESRVPPAAQPQPGDYSFDLGATLSAVVGLHSLVPAGAFTAEALGTERAGNGVVIDQGLVLTMGYLIMEAETVWIHPNEGNAVEGHVLGFDTETGFGLVQPLGRLDLSPLALGASDDAQVGSRVVTGGAGGRANSVAGSVIAREPFAGYWEYALDAAIFVTPAHPNWGGTALISERGNLIGVGSLQLESAAKGNTTRHVNMMVPTDLLKPLLPDLTAYGRVNKPARPWLGVYATEIENKVVVADIAGKGPAAQAELKSGDVILAVKGEPVTTLFEFYHKLWALGTAGVDVPLTLYSHGVTFDVTLKSVDRAKMMRAPKLH
ncbi:S1C family serine protease [Dongia sedimenti]|uniref:S1C family serine protease n=1 Tax=Dongia sedimenti TaxID=3064282 RepID=A0ABU0YHT3_9PROT|nr:S1C family serine protease [Rhodospirillaceae bacterium R-7]